MAGLERGSAGVPPRPQPGPAPYGRQACCARNTARALPARPRRSGSVEPRSGSQRRDQPRLRMSYYRIVLAEGQHDDLVQYLNHGLLISLWPTLRTLISRDVREVWERSFDELAHSAQAAA
ncbi:hypothetical protein [Streptomyces sp. A5-4]|uniref:hypothetical protein n=1 Tax=Streptomyces sp. A5-4 TaxID=3384771 RepID=UPI003DA894BB